MATTPRTKPVEAVEPEVETEITTEVEAQTAPAKRKITIKMDGLTLGDMIAFEDVTGQDITETLAPRVVKDPKTGKAVADPDDPKGRPLMETPPIKMRTMA